MVQWGYAVVFGTNKSQSEILHEGEILEKYHEAIVLAFRGAFVLPFWRMNAARFCFLRSVLSVLCKRRGTDYDAHRKMRGW